MPFHSRTKVNTASSMMPMASSARQGLPVVGNSNSPAGVPTNSPAGQSLPLKKHKLMSFMTSTKSSNAHANPPIHGNLKPTSSTLNQPKTFSLGNRKEGPNIIRPNLSKSQPLTVRGSRRVQVKNALTESKTLIQAKCRQIKHVFKDRIHGSQSSPDEFQQTNNSYETQKYMIRKLDVESHDSNNVQLECGAPKATAVKDRLSSTSRSSELRKGMLPLSSVEGSKSVSLEAALAESNPDLARGLREADKVEAKLYEASILEVNNQGNNNLQLECDAPKVAVVNGKFSSTTGWDQEGFKNTTARFGFSRSRCSSVSSNSIKESEAFKIDPQGMSLISDNGIGGSNSLNSGFSFLSDIPLDLPSCSDVASDCSFDQSNATLSVAVSTNSPTVQPLPLENHRLVPLMAHTNSSTPCANPTIRGILKSSSSVLNKPNKAVLKSVMFDLSKNSYKSPPPTLREDPSELFADFFTVLDTPQQTLTEFGANSYPNPVLDTDDQGSDYPQLASVVPKTATVNDLVLSTPNDGELSEGILTTSTLGERRKVSFEEFVAELRSIVAECQQEADDIETEQYGASILDINNQGSKYPQLASVGPKTATVNDLVLSTPNDGELSEGILTTSTLGERRKVSFEEFVAELRSIVAECQQEADDIETEQYGASILDINNQGSKYPQLVSDVTNTPAAKGKLSPGTTRDQRTSGEIFARSGFSHSRSSYACSNSTQESENRTVEELEGRPFFGNDHPGSKSPKYHLPSMSNISPGPPSHFCDICYHSLNRSNDKSPVTNSSNSPAVQSLTPENHRFIPFMAPTNLTTALPNPSVHGILNPISGALNQPKSLSVDNSKTGPKFIRPDLSQPQASILRGHWSAQVNNALTAPQDPFQPKRQSVRHIFNDCISI